MIKVSVTRAACSIAATYLSLLAADGFLSPRPSKWVRSMVMAVKNPGYDRRERRTVVEDLRREGRDAYPALADADTRVERVTALRDLSVLPVAGISRVTTVNCNESGRFSVYDSDRYGFNNDDSVYSDSRPRVVLIGDSFTHGSCVPSEENVIGWLRRKGYNAINLGWQGNGPLFELATLREYGAHLKPHIVLWLYCEYNDFSDLAREAQSPILMRYLQRDFSQGLIAKQPSIDEFWKRLYRLLGDENIDAPPRTSFLMTIERALALTNIRHELSGRRLGTRTPSEGLRPNFDLFERVLETANAEVGGFGGKLYLVYLPFSTSFVEDHSSGRSQVLAIASSLNIPVVDFYEEMKRDRDPLHIFTLRKSGHYTPEGYKRLADLIDRQAMNSDLQ